MAGKLPLKSDIINKNSHKTKKREEREGGGEGGGGGETEFILTKNEQRAACDFQHRREFKLNPSQRKCQINKQTNEQQGSLGG